MLGEAIIAMFSLMFLMWGAAIWASYKEDDYKDFRSISSRERKVA